MSQQTAKKGNSAVLPTTGVHTELDFESYQSTEACSYSRLKLLQRSPAHLRWELDHPTPPSPAMILGSAVDCLVLEPARFNERFDVSRQCSGITKKHERCTKNGVFRMKPNCFPHDEGKPAEIPEWYCSIHADPLDFPDLFDPITVLSKEDSDLAYNIAKAVKNHSTAGPLIDACDPQVSIVWDEILESAPLGFGHPANKLLSCKSRLDGLCEPMGLIIDLKTTTDATPEAFTRQLFNLGYHLQAAMYLRACKAHGIEVEDYVIIAAEKDPPNSVACYRLRDSAIAVGDREITRLMDVYHHCLKTNTWPSYPEQVTDIGLPDWVERRQ